jgi:iron complex transport system substrate-binding protein
MKRPNRLLGTIVAALCLVPLACGDDKAPDAASTESSAPAAETSASGGTAASTSFPVTVDAANGSVSIAARPQRIVSLSPTATEMLFAIGAGSQVIAVDSLSTYPANTPVTDLSAFEPNIEAIAAQEPDLVVLSDDINDVVAGLAALDIPVIQQPAATVLDDSYAQMEELGLATGNAEGAEQAVADMRARITAAIASASGSGAPLTYYHELDNTYYSVTSTTFIGAVYEAFGLSNIADAADSEGFGYPQLSAEYILQQDPALVFLADTKCCGESAETAAARPGWSELSAIADGTVIELDDDVASRWGPRLADFYEAIAAAIAKVQAAG